MKGSDVETCGLEDSKSLFHLGQTFTTFHRRITINRRGGKIGSNDRDAIQTSFGRNLVLLAGPDHRIIGNVSIKRFPDLAAIEAATDPPVDGVLSLEFGAGVYTLPAMSARMVSVTWSKASRLRVFWGDL